MVMKVEVMKVEVMIASHTNTDQQFHGLSFNLEKKTVNRGSVEGTCWSVFSLHETIGSKN